ncbi:MAG: glycosyl hydrolase [Balneolaceae bacterium]
MKQIIVLLTLAIIACSPKTNSSDKNDLPIDKNATEETVELYHFLNSLSGTATMFGHQDDLAYGYNWWAESGRSDVMETSGSYPAVYGWDLGHIVEMKNTNIDGINFDNMKDWILEGYSRGGIITLSWHMRNPVTRGDSWDKVPTISEILPGAKSHETFIEWLDIFAEYTLSLTDENGKLIPVIFRPFHEHNGDWFWWGKGNNSEEDYIALWRFTVEYLRDEKKLNNLLWAFSPDRSRINIDAFKTDYFYGYPGEDYVDIIGLDNYWDVGHPANQTDSEIMQEHLVRSLTYIAQIADSLGKIAALTETGQSGLPNPNIWTDTYLNAFQSNEWTKQITYMLVWRNATFERENRDHYYAPFVGHSSVSNFIEFKESEFILFEDELPNKDR